MEKTGAEKGAKRKVKEEGAGSAAGAKEEVRDTAVGSPAAGEDDRGRRKRRSGEGRERREEGEKIYKLPIKKRRRQKDRVAVNRPRKTKDLGKRPLVHVWQRANRHPSLPPTPQLPGALFKARGPF